MGSILYQPQAGGTPKHTRHAAAPSAPSTLQPDAARTARISTMGEFAASIAHEVNQPLSAIALHANAALQWLDHDPPRLEQVRAALALIADASTGASAMIRNLRALTGKAAPKAELFTADQAINDILLLLAPELAYRQVRVHLQLMLGQQLVCANRVQFQQVLMNLISNAIAAMQDHGDRPRILQIMSCHEHDMLCFSVADNGVGIAPEASEHIYHALHSSKPDGMGMGLAICLAVVQAHGGHLWHEAAAPDGTGAVFHFTLPIT